MTKEEAIKWLDKLYMGADITDEYGDMMDMQPYEEAFNMAIKALEQGPNNCDLISRQAVLKQTYNWSKDEFLRVTNPFDYLRKRINNLPSVTPKEKTGHWIAGVDRWGDIVTTVNGYRCDKCNTFNSDKDNYCPNCGAKMEVNKE